MQRINYQISISLIIGLFCTGSIFAQNNFDTPIIYLYVPNDTNESEELWMDNVELSIKRFGKTVYKDVPGFNGFKIQRIPIDSIPKKVSNSVFYGEAGAVYCNSNIFSRILWASAILSTQYVKQLGKKEGFDFSTVDAFNYIDAKFTNNIGRIQRSIISGAYYGNMPKAIFDEIIETADSVRIYEKHIASNDITILSDNKFHFYDIYASTVDYILAYILGHELAHGYERCVFEKESWVETYGIFKQIIDLQYNNETLCENPISIDELLSDQCGLRTLELTNTAIEKRLSTKYNTSLVEKTTYLSRLAALDIISMLLITGVKAKTEEITELDGKPVSSSTIMYPILDYSPGYMYGSLRTLLFSQALIHFENVELEKILFYPNAKNIAYGLIMGAAVECNLEGTLTQSQKLKLANFLKPYLPEKVIRKFFNTGFDYGKIKDNTYKNDFFDIEITFNTEWFVQSKEQERTIMKQGVDLIKDEDLKPLIEASKVNTAQLITILKYEFGSAVDSNPSFMALAENVKNFPGIKRGKDYLFHSKKLLQKSLPDKCSFEKDFYEKSIGNMEFDVMEVKINHLNQTIIQEYFSTIKKGFCLSFIISYSNDEEKKELYSIIDKIVQKRNFRK